MTFVLSMVNPLTPVAVAGPVTLNPENRELSAIATFPWIVGKSLKTVPDPENGSLVMPNCVCTRWIGRCSGPACPQRG